ncbi:hypothetical protein AB7179_02280 [Providencia manganoxydans]|uniref:hypothetical protein n=1 Tax=Providencia manganoxydans TaxID=2923283 RepID=UPI0034DD9CAD
MKKKVVTSLGILLVIVGGVFWSLLYEEQLPEPSQESLNYITSELDGLNLEESIEKIRKDKKSFDLFLKWGGLMIYIVRELKSHNQKNIIKKIIVF